MIVKNAFILTMTILMFCADCYSTSVKNVHRESRATEYIPREDVTFLLYTSNDGIAEELKIDDTPSILRSKFNSSNLTKIMTHGWQNDANAEYMIMFKKAFLKQSQYNYISVDWGKCAFEDIGKSLFCMQNVGRYIGLLIEQLSNVANLRLDDVHLIGHSLGAHTMSYVSRKFKKKKIKRITGLDPASAFFELAGPRYTLDPSDAKIVDVIHTGLDTFGLKKPVGTINFYVNGGQNQPGCRPQDTMEDDCNHKSSNLFFAETIPEKSRKKYIGKMCDTLDDALKEDCNGKQGIMGLDADKIDPGIYYVKVKERPNPPV